MPRYECADCGGQIKSNEFNCKHCGAELQWNSPTDNGSKKVITWIIAVVIGIVLSIIGLKVIGVIGDNSLNNKPNIKEKLCEDEVLKKLVSPGSAKFGENRIIVSLGLKNYVDSQNGFGGLMRTNFVCMFNISTNELTVAFDSDEPNLHKLYEIIAK